MHGRSAGLAPARGHREKLRGRDHLERAPCSAAHRPAALPFPGLLADAEPRKYGGEHFIAHLVAADLPQRQQRRPQVDGPEVQRQVAAHAGQRTRKRVPSTQQRLRLALIDGPGNAAGRQLGRAGCRQHGGSQRAQALACGEGWKGREGGRKGRHSAVGISTFHAKATRAGQGKQWGRGSNGCRRPYGGEKPPRAAGRPHRAQRLHTRLWLPR